MGQQTEEYNEWAEHTLSELYDALFGTEERLQMLEDQPVNYYSAGYSDTYLAAMSQVWGIQGCRDDIAAIRAEIDRRREEEAEKNAED
jgi:hypothetical protein